MKKLKNLLLILLLMFAFTSCDTNTENIPDDPNINDEGNNNENNPGNENDGNENGGNEQETPVTNKLDTPVINIVGEYVRWRSISNATAYVVNVNGVEYTVSAAYKLDQTEAGDYVIKVKAIDQNNVYKDSDYSNEITYKVEAKVELKETKVYLVGDSTVSAFSDNYYYPRYGYGTQFANYFDSKAQIVNLALSGRSSLSFIQEANYNTLKSSIKAGDYLVIGFGHNDEKSDDPSRYSEPLGSIDTKGSFKYNLYNYYIKIAKDAGATPILCTPVVRANSQNNYTGSSGHITNGADYSKVILALGEETNTTVIDLTTKTKELYTSIGYHEAIKFHAWTSNASASVDNTHLNIYGAKMVAYIFATELQKTTNVLANYVLKDIAKPTEADRVTNPNYVATTYCAPELSYYSAPENFATLTDGWYGTAFGDTGGNPSASTSGYLAKEEVAGTFIVGQDASLASNSSKGKITSTEGIAFLFRQVSKSKNFTLTADVKVIKETDKSQAGFGLMLRDDCYINQTTADSTITSNYVAAGMYGASSSKTNIVYSRENTVLKDSAGSIASLHQTDDTASLSIVRLGQVVTCTVTYKGTTYTKTYTDFDFVAKDNNYMYIGMYATRGTVCEFTNVSFEITGDAIEA
jgi:lysophospholipase L1-like esterase